MSRPGTKAALLPAAGLAALTIALAAPALAQEAGLPPLPGAAQAEGPAPPGDEKAAGPLGVQGNAAVPQGAGRRESSVPGGSRLLEALAEGPTAVPEGAVAPVFAAEGCPRALLRRLLAGAAGEADALAALGIEREILTLCRERQEIVTALFETEARLRELAPGEPAPALPQAPERAAAPPAENAEDAEPAPPAAAQAPPSPLRAALEAESREETEAGPAKPSWSWFSIIGTAGALRAGVSDGSGVWFVRAGDALPDGSTVAAIAGRPASVRIRGGDGGGEGGGAVSLPWRAHPGGAP